MNRAGSKVVHESFPGVLRLVDGSSCLVPCLTDPRNCWKITIPSSQQASNVGSGGPLVWLKVVASVVRWTPVSIKGRPFPTEGGLWEIFMMLANHSKTTANFCPFCLEPYGFLPLPAERIPGVISR